MSSSVTAGNLIRSPWIGDVEIDPECQLVFPSGLPGFEDHHQFLAVEIPAHRPVIYLQSTGDPPVCFVALPVHIIHPGFRICLSEEERIVLDMDPAFEPVTGLDIICLALLMPSDETVEASPDSVIVINLHNRCGVQCMPSSHNPATFRLSAGRGWVRIC